MFRDCQEKFVTVWALSFWAALCIFNSFIFVESVLLGVPSIKICKQKEKHLFGNFSIKIIAKCLSWKFSILICYLWVKNKGIQSINISNDIKYDLIGFKYISFDNQNLLIFFCQLTYFKATELNGDMINSSNCDNSTRAYSTLFWRNQLLNTKNETAQKPDKSIPAVSFFASRRSTTRITSARITTARISTAWHVWYTCTAAKNMCVSNVMTMYSSLGLVRLG